MQFDCGQPIIIDHLDRLLKHVIGADKDRIFGTTQPDFRNSIRIHDQQS